MRPGGIACPGCGADAHSLQPLGPTSSVCGACQLALRHCESCGALEVVTARFCSACGAQSDAIGTAPVFALAPERLEAPKERAARAEPSFASPLPGVAGREPHVAMVAGLPCVWLARTGEVFSLARRSVVALLAEAARTPGMWGPPVVYRRAGDCLETGHHALQVGAEGLALWPTHRLTDARWSLQVSPAAREGRLSASELGAAGMLPAYGWLSPARLVVAGQDGGGAAARVQVLRVEAEGADTRVIAEGRPQLLRSDRGGPPDGWRGAVLEGDERVFLVVGPGRVWRVPSDGEALGAAQAFTMLAGPAFVHATPLASLGGRHDQLIVKVRSLDPVLGHPLERLERWILTASLEVHREPLLGETLVRAAGVVRAGATALLTVLSARTDGLAQAHPLTRPDAAARTTITAPPGTQVITGAVGPDYVAVAAQAAGQRYLLTAPLSRGPRGYRSSSPVSVAGGERLELACGPASLALLSVGAVNARVALHALEDSGTRVGGAG